MENAQRNLLLVECLNEAQTASGVLQAVFNTEGQDKARQIRKNTMRLMMKVVASQRMSIQRLRSVWTYDRFGQFWEKDVPNGTDSFFKESFRVDRATFKILVEKLKVLEKRDTFFRKCIPLEKRVAIALYTLGSSAEYRTIGRLFGVGNSTVCKLLQDFCKECWLILSPDFLPREFLTQENVDACVRGFDALGFPQCFGAIDGCHIEMKPCVEDAADYYNYKGWYSVNLFAMVDYRYRFVYVNIGHPGRCNDSMIFETSKLKKTFEESLLPQSNAKIIEGISVPVMLIGDSAFRFSKTVMKPYPFSVDLTTNQKIFNKNLSTARRTVENAFGHLKARFRRIGKGLDNAPSKINQIILCCCVLHNFFNHHNSHVNELWLEMQTRNEIRQQRVQPETTDCIYDGEPSAEEIRRAISSLCLSRET